MILPYIEQDNRYAFFDFRYDVHGSPEGPPPDFPHRVAKSQDVAIYICPSDPANMYYSEGGRNFGRSNYFANIGATASHRDATSERSGVFNVALFLPSVPAGTTYPSGYGRVTNKISVGNIPDGTSTTAMFAEIKRSNLHWDARGQWDRQTMIILPAASFSDLAPVLPDCDTYNPTGSVIRYVGQQYYRYIPATSLYSHTTPPNYKGLDCGSNNFYAAHLAARSYHPGGVNVCFCDGSVRFIRDTILLDTWKALGTRAGGEVVDGSAF